MIEEISVGGVLFPPIMAYMFAAAVCWMLTTRLLAALGAYGFVWHPPLFNTALYVIWLAVLLAATFS